MNFKIPAIPLYYGIGITSLKRKYFINGVVFGGIVGSRVVSVIRLVEAFVNKKVNACGISEHGCCLSNVNITV